LVSPTPLALRNSLTRIARFIAVALLPMVGGPSLCSGQAPATQTVPPNDPVYRFIDRLVAARLVDTIILGQRSMSRREVARILAEARGRAGESPWLSERIREYAEAFPDTAPKGPVMASADADAIYLDSPGRGIAPDATGAIDVDLNPLASNRFGRPIANGQSYSYKLSVSAGFTPWLAGAASERMSWLEPRSLEGKGTTDVEQLYLRALWKNVGVLVGRDYLFLGQAVESGIMTSMNSRGIDQVRLSSDQPFRLPWLLRHLGPAQATVALGDLGRDQLFPHTRFLGYKFSLRPHPRFEIGTGLVEQVGGEGAPGGTFLQKAVDAIPIIDAVILHRNFLFSNKFVGVDVRYTLPGAQGVQFYAEGVFDDFDLRRVRSVFTEDAGYVWGLSASCFGQCGRVRSSVEYHVTGLRFYTHGWYRGGFTLEQKFIGDPLGPRGRGAYGIVEIDGRRRAMTFNLAYEDRSGNKYGAVSSTPDDSDFRFILLERNPAERRWRSTVTATFGGIHDRVGYTVSGGAERVENFGHVDGAWKTNGLVQAGIQIRGTPPFF
jgi:hypothetical protein